MNVRVLWDTGRRGNVRHIAKNGLTPAEVERVLLNPRLPTHVSRSTGRPCKFGRTRAGKYIIVIWDEVGGDPLLLYPVTAYEVPEP
jgi:hypothetical protein